MNCLFILKFGQLITGMKYNLENKKLNGKVDLVFVK